MSYVCNACSDGDHSDCDGCECDMCSGNSAESSTTGSAEPKCNNPLHAMTDGTPYPHEIGASCMPTPPTPQTETVTLTRDEVSLIADALERAEGLCDLEDYSDAAKQMRNALALLRSAETQR